MAHDSKLEYVPAKVLISQEKAELSVAARGTDPTDWAELLLTLRVDDSDRRPLANFISAGEGFLLTFSMSLSPEERLSLAEALTTLNPEMNPHVGEAVFEFEDLKEPDELE